MTEAIACADLSRRSCSVSGCDGGSLPAVNAAANFAVSHAFWNWRTSGNMSGRGRAWSSVLAS